jgi:signal transduction histidine kinase/DNA-binding response OmpR family regulator/ligand-binding sensor domain-containing protein
VASVWAQQLRFERFDMSNGLSQNNINCLEIDGKGNIWTGTLDGINVYNGYYFEIHKPFGNRKGSLVGNHVTAIGRGIGADMWIVTRGGGLNHFCSLNQQFSLVELPGFSGFDIEQARNIVQTCDTLLWLSDNLSLSCVIFTNDNVHLFMHKFNSQLRGMIRFDATSILAFGDFGIVKLMLVPESNDTKLYVEELYAEPCYGLFRESGKYYFVNTEGISVTRNFDLFDNEIKFSSEHLNLFNLVGINDFVMNENAFWLGGNSFFIRFYAVGNEYVAEKFEHNPLNPYAFKGHGITRICPDDLGNLWIGTNKNGLVHLNKLKNQFKHYSWEVEAQTDPGSNPVRAICKTRDRELWLGFDREGIGVWSGGKQLRHYLNYYTANNQQKPILQVRSIFEDSKGTIWIGEMNELCYYNPEKDRFETVDNRYSWRWPYRCYSIKEEQESILTLSGNEGLGFLDLNKGYLSVLPLSPDNQYFEQSVRDFVLDDNGNYWIAPDDHGIVKVSFPDIEYQRILADNHGLSDNKVYCMAVAGDSLWIGTNAGLNLFSIKQNRVLDIFYEEDGLSNNVVYSIYIDNNGNLWMSTNRGVSFYNTKTSVFGTFLPNDFFMDDAYFFDVDGTIFYGGYSGVVSFKYNEITTQLPEAKPHFEQFSLLGNVVFPGDTVDGAILFDNSLKHGANIKLSYKQNTFSIRFNAYPFDFPNRNRYRYRLRNFHDDWLEVSTNREASFTKVPPGNYVFELRASSGNADFGDVNEIYIEIVPPFWLTGWFRALLLIIFILLVFIVYRLRIRQVKRRNIWLQQKVDEQTAELKEQNRTIIEMSNKLHEADQSKLRFFTNISHEFRTPLTLILGNIEKLDKQSGLAVASIKNNALRLLRLINQLIDLRKLDQDQLKLAVTEIEIVSFVNTVVGNFESEAKKQDIDLQLISNVKELKVWLDYDKIEKIIYNLVSNALKYTPHGKSITVRIELLDDDFNIHVRDQGIGIAANELPHIFDRFYRAKSNNAHVSGHGIGLSMVKGLTQIMHGRVVASSVEGEGSCFTVTFKTGRAHFAPVDFDALKPGIEYSIKDLQYPRFIETLGGKNILIVEDNAELAGFIQNILSKNFKVEVAKDGQKAIELMTSFHPHLIISDIMMPVMDGIEFCRHVKNQTETSHIPLILLSAKTDIETRVDGLETGADDYIEKPFDSKLLVAKINSLLLNREKLKEAFRVGINAFLSPENMPAVDLEFLKSVDRVVGHNISNSHFSVEALSDELNMSRATFYRKFTDISGMKPADYIRKTRLKKAYRMLENEALPVAEICERVGFQNVSHFRKCFREEFGATPGRVQKGLKNQGLPKY